MKQDLTNTPLGQGLKKVLDDYEENWEEKLVSMLEHYDGDLMSTYIGKLIQFIKNLRKHDELELIKMIDNYFRSDKSDSLYLQIKDYYNK